jgi:purine-cytosine permease-like protein
LDKLPDSSWLKIFELKVNITAAISVASTLILYLAAHDMLYLGDLPKYIPAILALVAIFSGVITASHFLLRRHLSCQKIRSSTQVAY